MIDPYKNINWQTIQLVQSMSHEHEYHYPSVADAVNDFYSRGFRHFNFSEYLRKPPENDGEPNFPEDFYSVGGVYPLSRWMENVPQDIIETPSCEMFGLGGHIVMMSAVKGIGYNDEHFPNAGEGGNQIYDVANEQPIELNLLEQFQYALDGIPDPNSAGQIGGLLFEDGGGLYEAHSGGFNRIITRLDMDDRYLGCDIYNDRRGDDATEIRESRGWNIDVWEAVLRTGRRCWGFVESDRGRRGCNILLLNEFTDHDAMKAYREGRFYGKMSWDDTGLKFKNIHDDGDKLIVETEGATNGIRIVSDSGEVALTSSNSIEYVYPKRGGFVDHIFLRAEAYGEVFDPEMEEDLREYPAKNYNDGIRYVDEIYSQPILYKTQAIQRKEKIKKSFAAGLI